MSYGGGYSGSRGGGGGYSNGYENSSSRYSGGYSGAGDYGSSYSNGYDYLRLEVEVFWLPKIHVCLMTDLIIFMASFGLYLSDGYECFNVLTSSTDTVALVMATLAEAATATQTAQTAQTAMVVAMVVQLMDMEVVAALEAATRCPTSEPTSRRNSGVSHVGQLI